jgi:hypothetical protein
VLIGDQDGDGKADVVVDGYDWEAGVPGDPLSSGGIAYFSSGPRRRSELEHAELQLYGLCGSVLMDLQDVGDVTGDGLDDVVVISYGAMDRGLVFVAPHLGDLTGHHSLATASRAIIVHDRSTANGSAFAHFSPGPGDAGPRRQRRRRAGPHGRGRRRGVRVPGPISGLLNIGDADLTLEDGGQSWGYDGRRGRPRRGRPPRPRRRRPHLRRRVPRVPGRDLRVPRHRPPRRPGAPMIPGAEAGGARLRVFVPSWSSPSPTVGNLEPR